MTSKGINWCNKIIEVGLIIFALSLPISLSGMEVGYYLAFLAWISKMAIKRKVDLPSTPLDLPIIFFWIISFISIIFSIEPAESAERLRKIPLFFLPYLMVDSIKDEKRILRLIQLLVISCTLAAIPGIFNYFNGAERAYSSIGNYQIFWISDFGTFMLLVLPFAVISVIFKKFLSLKIVNGLISIVIAGCIITTYTRSIYLSILGIFIILGLFIEKKKYKFLSILCLLIIIFFSYSKISDRFKSVNDSGIQERLYMWQIGWQIFKEYPLTGVGIDCIEMKYPKYMNPQDKWPIRGNLHNNYIQEMTEKGMGGLIAFFWLFGAFFWVGYDIHRRGLNKIQRGIALACIIGYVGYMIEGCFSTTLFVPKILRLWLFIMGILLTVNKFCFIQEKLNRNFKKILIIKLREIGDTVLATPAIKAIRRSFPDCFLSIVVPKTSSGVLFNNPHLDEIVSYDRKRSIRDYLSLIWRLRKRKFDLAINLHASHRSALIAYLSGARFRVVNNHNGKNYYANIPIQKLAEIPKTAIEKDLVACEAVGIETNDKTTEVFPHSDDCKKIEELLKNKEIDLLNNSLMAIFIGAREEIRCWSLEKYIRLCEFFHDKEGIKVLLIYGPKEEGKVRYIMESMKKPPIVLGNLSLLQLASLFGKCNLFIGNISGPIHIAVAMKIPTITICAPKYVEEWHPYNTSRHKVVSKYPNCRECEKNFCDEGVCLEEVLVEEVIKEVEALSCIPRVVDLNKSEQIRL